jgi:hypothetical protein
VNPGNPPSCRSVPCGIVRCASQESQHSPSGPLTSSITFGEHHRPPASCINKAGFQSVPECYGKHALRESHHGLFRISGISAFGWRQTMPNDSGAGKLRPQPSRGHSAYSGLRHSVADRAAPTSPLRRVWRIPSQCAKRPLPSSRLPKFFLLC